MREFGISTWSLRAKIITLTLSISLPLAAFALYWIGGGLVSAADPEYVWEDISGGAEHYSTIVGQSADGSTLVSLGNEVKISTDSGYTWRDALNIPGGGSFYSQVELSSDGGTIAICKANDLFLSSDKGQSWTTKTMPGSCSMDYNSFAMAVDNAQVMAVAAPNYIYTSDDSGDTWQERSGSGQAAVGAAPAYKEVYMSNDGMRLMAHSLHGSYTGVYMSSDGGIIWTMNSSVAPLKLSDFVVSPDLMTALATGHPVRENQEDGIYITTDGGVSWVRSTVNDGIGDLGTITSDGRIIMLDLDNQQRIVSSDGGLSWNAVPDTSLSDQMGACDIAASSNAGLIFFTDCYDGLLLREGESSWDVAIMMGQHWWASIDTSADGNVVLAADADGAAFISHNGGDSWKYAGMGDNLFGASVSPDGSIMAISNGTYSGDQHAVYVSRDGGATWQGSLAYTGSYMNDVEILGNTGVIMAADDNTAYVSYDAGVSWSVFPGLNAANIYHTTSSSDGRHVAVVTTDTTGDNLYVSNDAGASWASHRFGPVAGSWALYDLDISDDGQKIAAIGQDYGVSYNIIISDDGGSTWRDVVGNGLPEMTGYDGSRVSEVAMSGDGNLVLVSSTDGEILISNDGGITWADHSGPFKDYYISSYNVPVAVSNDGSRIYVAGGSMLAGRLTSDSDNSGGGSGGGGNSNGGGTGSGGSDSGGNGSSDGQSLGDNSGVNGNSLANTGQAAGYVLAGSIALVLAGGALLRRR